MITLWIFLAAFLAAAHYFAGAYFSTQPRTSGNRTAARVSFTIACLIPMIGGPVLLFRAGFGWSAIAIPWSVLLRSRLHCAFAENSLNLPRGEKDA